MLCLPPKCRRILSGCTTEVFLGFFFRDPASSTKYKEAEPLTPSFSDSDLFPKNILNKKRAHKPLLWQFVKDLCLHENKCLEDLLQANFSCISNGNGLKYRKKKE